MPIPDTLKSGESLPTNVRLKSAGKKTYAVLQNDRNFVLYRTENGQPLWASGSRDTFFSDANPFKGAMVMQPDGNLVLKDANGSPLWTSAQGNYGLPVPGATLTVQDDGNMVIRDGAGTVVWSTETYGFSNHHQGSGLFDYIGDVVSSVTDTVISVPGVDFVAGQVKDFANTDIGKYAFRAISSAVAPTLFVINPGMGLFVSSVLGATLGGAAFVMPGLVRGEPIDKAFLNELKDYASKVGVTVKVGDAIDALGGPLGKQVADQFTKAADSVAKWADDNGIDLDRVAIQTQDFRNKIAQQLDPEVLAKQLGVTPQIAQLAIDAATRTQNARGLKFGPTGLVVTDVHWKPVQSYYDAQGKLHFGTPPVAPPPVALKVTPRVLSTAALTPPKDDVMVPAVGAAILLGIIAYMTRDSWMPKPKR